MIYNDWKLDMVNGYLSITRESNPDEQVQLDPETAYELLEYLYQHRDELYQVVHQECRG